jgi:hypothetical protein
MVHTLDKSDILDFSIDNQKTLLEFRKMVAPSLGISYADLVLVGKYQFNHTYNSKKLADVPGLEDCATLYAVLQINGGKLLYK